MSFFKTFFSHTRLRESEVVRDPSWQEAEPTDLVIAILGEIGVGRSTFINTLFGKDVAPVGHGLESCTMFVTAYPYHDSEFPNNRIVLVDTPGFDGTAETFLKIMWRIKAWLAQSYNAHMKMAGFIYLYDISSNRSLNQWHGSSRRIFEVFERLCGQAAARKIVLVTTRWDSILPDDFRTGQRREQQLKDKYWKDMIDIGSAVLRGSSQRGCIDFLLGKQAIYPLRIQNELETICSAQIPYARFITRFFRSETASDKLAALLKTRRELVPQLCSSSEDRGISRTALENDEEIKAILRSIAEAVEISQRLLQVFG